MMRPAAKSGDEQDATSHSARRALKSLDRPGVKARAKTAINRRDRRAGRHEAQEGATE
jgi:hypothetical protein